MKFETPRFRIIDVREKDIITFPEGLLGFPDQTRYVLLEEKMAGPFLTLQSLDNPNSSFILINPALVDKNYELDIDIKGLKQLECEEITDSLTIHCVVCIGYIIKDTTANLQGPIIINNKNNIGAQFVRADDKYSTSEPIIKD